MNKLKLLTLLFLSALLLQNCKKDTVTATTSSTAPMQATINDVTWLPDTISTSITYNAETKVKTFVCQGTHAQKRVDITINLANATDDAGFRLGTYTADNAGSVFMKYSEQQKDDSGNYVFVQVGTVDPGSGIVTITSVDTTKKLITGTFTIISRTPVYDGDGNVIATTNNTISAGIFNNLPYTDTVAQ